MLIGSGTFQYKLHPTLATCYGFPYSAYGLLNTSLYGFIAVGINGGIL